MPSILESVWQKRNAHISIPPLRRRASRRRAEARDLLVGEKKNKHLLLKGSSLARSLVSFPSRKLRPLSLSLSTGGRGGARGGLREARVSSGALGGNDAGCEKRYLIVTYAVEFDRVHYPRAAGAVDKGLDARK